MILREFYLLGIKLILNAENFGDLQKYLPIFPEKIPTT